MNGNVNWGGYVETSSQPQKGVFEIGLVMAGAISAGAYTAGVIDFLIEALDAWEAAKIAQASSYGDDTSRWELPGHRVRLRVVSGASAGSMTGAVMAVALRHAFPSVRDISTGTRNPLYRPWVEQIDISNLLQTRDLPAPDSPVVSLLDSTALMSILQEALNFRGGPPPRRQYLEPGLRFIFTEGNLRGVPYFLALPGNAIAGLAMIAHSDYQSFCVSYGGDVTPLLHADDVRIDAANSGADASWQRLGLAAISSGAFPIGLAPRVIQRDGAEYNYRFTIVPGYDAKGTQIVNLVPSWKPAPNPYRTVVVDGGTMNNEPLELARTELAGLAGRNPRDGNLACRATVLIDPFPDLAGTVDDPMRGQREDLIGAAMALIGAWKDQARFDPVDLALAADENTYSRFLISPSRGKSSESKDFALACGALGGFSGFLSQQYRHHDYVLGRRNCQQFLREHFCLPVENREVFGGVNQVLKQSGSPWYVSGNGFGCLPIIPLVGKLRDEEPLPTWPAGVFVPESLREAVTERLDAVLDNLLRNSVKLNWFYRWAAKLGLAKVRSVAVDKSVEIVTRQLQERGLIVGG